MNDGEYIIGLFVGLMIGIIAGIILYSLIFDPVEESYKQGQIDVLTGQIKYELVINPDSTRTWEKINED